MIMEKVNFLLFDLTDENIKSNQELQEMLLSGENILSEVAQIKNNAFTDSPFVKQIEARGENDYSHIKDEEMSKLLEVDKNNLLYYEFFRTTIKNARSMTVSYNYHGNLGQFKLLTNKSMFKSNKHIFEIRCKVDDKWSSWQAIAGKFIIAKEYRFGPGGIREKYNFMGSNEFEIIKQDYQLRYCGRVFDDMLMENTLSKIHNDPFNHSVVKMIDPDTNIVLFDLQMSDKIHFDSQVPNEISVKEISKFWMDYVKRYRE